MHRLEQSWEFARKNVSMYVCVLVCVLVGKPRSTRLELCFRAVCTFAMRQFFAMFPMFWSKDAIRRRTKTCDRKLRCPKILCTTLDLLPHCSCWTLSQTHMSTHIHTHTHEQKYRKPNKHPVWCIKANPSRCARLEWVVHERYEHIILTTADEE